MEQTKEPFTSFNEALPVKPGYYLWRNFNSLFANNIGHNIIYLYSDKTALLIGTDIHLDISHYFYNGAWLGPYEYGFISKMVKHPDVLHDLKILQTQLVNMKK